MRAAGLALSLLGLAPAALAAVPGEDDPGTATRVPSLPFEDARPAAGPGRGAWYAYTPAQDETVLCSVSTPGSGSTVSLWVQEGEAMVPLQRAVAAADGPPALVRARLAAGTAYLVHAGTPAGRRGRRSRVVIRLEQAPRRLSSVQACVTDVAVMWDGTVTVRGTVQSDEGGQTDVYVQVTQSLGPFVAQGDGHATTACAPTASRWSASVRSCTWIGFGAGRMSVSAVVWAYDGYGSATHEVAPAWFVADPAP